MRYLILSVSAVVLNSTAAFAEPDGYPAGVEAKTYVSSADMTEQPTLFWRPADQSKLAPLLVALHTWSGGYDQQGGEPTYAKWCQEAEWVFIHPHFRGRNRTPDTMGSDLVVKDILSAIDFAKANANVDTSRIYCMGGSGGGHASLLMAGRAPEIWAGVSAWCGISDIAAWHGQCRASEKFTRYADDIELALRGLPTNDLECLTDATYRSPVFWLKNATGVPLDINHGINDGRAGSVPFTHSLHAWNKLVPASEQFSDKEIADFYESRTPPESFTSDAPLYGSRKPLYRRTHGHTRLTLFDGGHEIIHNAGLNWLAAQQKGQPVKWDAKEMIDISEAKTESGR